MSRCDPSGPRSFPWRSLGHAGLLALCLLPCAALPAASQPAHIAIVIGNGAYTTPSAMAPLPGCPVSARYVATALRHLGYDVTDQYDLGLGPLDAAVGSFARRLHDSPDAAAVVYVCGGLSSLNARPFLLPVSARLERPSDVLTQGVLARTVLNAMVAGHVQVGLIALDGFVSPTAASPDADVKTLTDAATTAGIGMAISLPKPTDSATPLSAALIAELAGPQVKLAAVLDGLHTRITNDVLVGLTMPAPSGFLAGEPPPPPPVAAPPPPVAAAPTPEPVAPVAPAAPVAQAAPAPMMPAEAAMTPFDRRRVQLALTALGYYSGVSDGVFGPNTRAAIRRFQFEIGAEMTGVITAEQATRLVHPHG